MEHTFIQPVSMQVTQEQYERDLREPLLKMGYKEIYMIGWDETPILATNYGGIKYGINNIAKGCKEHNNRYFIPEYNPKLFLAITAMSSKECGIYGEWWYCTENVKMLSDGRIEYDKGKLYMGLDNKRIINNLRDINHYWRYDNKFEHFRKATLQELITNFTKQENIMKEITTELITELKNLIAPENEEKFNKLMGIEKPMFKKEEFITGDKVVLRDGNIYLVIRDCNAGTAKNQIFVLLQCVISGGFMSASSYDNKLCNVGQYSKYDIMKIYRWKKGTIVNNSLSIDLTGYTLIWNRD